MRTAKHRGQFLGGRSLGGRNLGGASHHYTAALVFLGSHSLCCCLPFHSSVTPEIIQRGRHRLTFPPPLAELQDIPGACSGRQPQGQEVRRLLVRMGQKKKRKPSPPVLVAGASACLALSHGSAGVREEIRKASFWSSDKELWKVLNPLKLNMILSEHAFS